MGRRPTGVADLVAQAEANGYKRGAHKERDQIPHREKHVKKTKRDQDATLKRYVLWHLAEMQRDSVQRGLPPPDEDSARQCCLRSGVEAPDLATVKDFLRFYIATSRPQLSKIPTVDSINTVAEWFFAGFTRVTGTETDADERSEVYDWVRKVLTIEGLVVNKRRPKHNFTTHNLTRILLTLWTQDDLIFIPERYRIQFTFIIRVYCWTGARLSAFFTNGLRYRDIDLVLQRASSGGWRLIYNIKQRWVKNNRDPENIVFGSAGKEHKTFVYNDAAFLLAMAVADGALFGFESLDDLQRQEIPTDENEIILRYKESALNQPILRKCTKVDGVTDEPMPKAAFTEVFGSTLKNAGYFCATSIHAIRRQLGKQVDERYTEVQRSQHLTQGDPRVFGQSYVANTSAVDGQAAYLGEKADHSHIDYFQGLEKFRERGLPCELPAHLEEQVSRDPQLLMLRSEVRELLHRDTEAAKEAKRRMASCHKTLKRLALRQYQETWVQKRRDWKILTRGKEQPQDLCKTDIVRNLCLLVPERGRLAQRMASDEPLSSGAMWHATCDLHSLCGRDLSVLYLPGHEPLDGSCPVKCCQLNLGSLLKSRRNQHIQECLRREFASKHERLQSDIHYCHECFEWVFGGEEWADHCRVHIQVPVSRRCGTITYCHTLVRPGHCPFCLGDEALPATRRLDSWSRDHKLWIHVNEHVRGLSWPTICPHPYCSSSLDNETSLQFHFIDEHGFSRTRPRRTLPEKDSSRKRKAADDESTFSWLPAEPLGRASPSKRSRLRAPTVCPSLISSWDSVADFQLAHIDHPENFPSEAEPSSLDLDGGQHGLPLDGMPREPECKPEMLPICDPSSADAFLHGDSVFSQLLRSPSPSCLSSTTTDDTDGLTTVTAEKTEINSPSSLNTRSAIHEHNQGHKSLGHRSGLRIHLLVNPPKIKIKLRLNKPQMKEQGKQRQPKRA